VKVLFDHNVPHRLRYSLPAHEVSSADEMGWSELENGELMRAAELAGFVVMVAAESRPSRVAPKLIR
jgi:predicted nuclease of predicted toxin-antitoxin system